MHRDGPLPSIPVRVTTDKTEIGVYWYDPVSAKPEYIEFSRIGPHPEFTILHEVRHFLDQQGLGTAGTWGSDLPELIPLLDTIIESAAFAALEALDLIDHRVRYHLQNKELFARAYAQYIVVKTRNPELLQQLEVKRSGKSISLGEHLQWRNQDFEPIAQEIDKLFKRKGWIS